MRNNRRIIYFASTGILTLIVIWIAMMFIFAHDRAASLFIDLGYSESLVYPLAAAKMIAITYIWIGRNQTLKYFAYMGFLFDFLLAFAAHVNAENTNYIIVLIAILCLAASFFSLDESSEGQRIF